MLVRRASLLCAVLVFASVHVLLAQGGFRAVWGAGPDDVWAVGDQPGPVHYVGGRWRTVPVGEEYPVTLYAVWGTGPRNVFFGGPNGTMLRWNGSALSRMTVPTENDIIALAGRSATEVYALVRHSASRRASVLRWDGQAWTEYPLPTTYDVGWRVATGLTVAGPDAIVCGASVPDPRGNPRGYGELDALRAGSWRPLGRQDSIFRSWRWEAVLALRDTVFLVGEAYDPRAIGILVRAGPGSWSSLPPPAGLGMRFAFVTGEGTLLVVSTDGRFAFRALGQWVVVGPPDPPSASVSQQELMRQALAWSELTNARAAWGPSAADFYVVTGEGRVVRVRGITPAIVHDVSCADAAIAAASPYCRMLPRQ